MRLTAHLDLNLVPLDQEDDVTVLLEITAPTPATDAVRTPATVQVVLDRSGSMAGRRLEGAQRALLSLIDRLDPADNFGLVSFDDSARVELPAAPLTDKNAAKQTIAALRPGGSTDLSSGLLRGIQEARRASADRGATLLLISDGHANAGITDHDRLAALARDAHRHGVSTTALGYGLGYDERLMAAIADGGTGTSLHAEDPDTAVQLIAAEVTGLLSKVVQAASITITPHAPVTSVLLYGGLPSTTLGTSIMTELGDLYAGETRKVLLRLAVPGMAALGLATVAEIVLTYAESQTLTTYTVTTPISVNVVPGDQAAGRVPDPVVRAERLFLEAQEAKHRASEALLKGDLTKAETILTAAEAALRKGQEWAPDPDELAAQAEELRRYTREARQDAARISKEARASWYYGTRKRGRPSNEPEPE